MNRKEAGAVLMFRGGSVIFDDSSSERVAEEKPSEISSKYVIVVQCYNQSNHSIFTQINFSTSL